MNLPLMLRPRKIRARPSENCFYRLRFFGFRFFTVRLSSTVVTPFFFVSRTFAALIHLPSFGRFIVAMFLVVDPFRKNFVLAARDREQFGHDVIDHVR